MELEGVAFCSKVIIRAPDIVLEGGALSVMNDIGGYSMVEGEQG
jgi:hypothetical protein